MNRTIFTAAVVCAVVLTASTASAQNLRVGGRVAGSFQELTQPADPQGAPTVLYGTAFTGMGFAVGATAYRDLAHISLGSIFVNTDLLVAYQRARGYAKSRTSDAQRELVLTTTGLRLPVLLGLGFQGNAAKIDLALGPEVLLGLSSSSKVSQSGTTAPVPKPVATRPVTHVGATGQVGLTFEMANGAQVPIDLRLTWDPFVPKSTKDRFDNYVDTSNTGKYGVAFNWQGFVTIGYVIPL